MTQAAGGPAHRYARAAFEVAVAKHDLNGWLADLEKLEVVLGDPDVALALENPRLDDGKRVALALSLAPDRLNQERSNFVKLLVLGRRTNLISEIRSDFQAMVDEAEGRTELEVIVSAELSAADLKTITAELTEKMGQEVKINVRVDPEILGGLIIRHGDHVVDGSVRRRLAEMREELLAG